MLLEPNGIDMFYVDESIKHPSYAVSSITVPFLKPSDKDWAFVWQETYDAADQWRRALSKRHGIRFRKELHAYELLRSQGLYRRGNLNLLPDAAHDLYQDALETLTFLPPGAIITVCARPSAKGTHLKGIDVCLSTLFQRLRMQCKASRSNGLLFFDEGRDEYISLFRKAQKYLPTGSSLGGWEGGAQAKNLPLTMFPKDANFKLSHLSYFVQIADLIVYSARLKIEFEAGLLPEKRVRRGHHSLYDRIPRGLINLRATRARDDGIVTI